MKHILTFILWLLVISVHCQSYDIIIRGGKIIDGTGNPWYYSDVAIANGKIIKIGNLGEGTAIRTIDAKGWVISPGFIDVHTHIEGNDLKIPTAPNFIFDGVTTVVTGNCGSSNRDIAQYFYKLDSVKTSINVSTLIGHNTVRRAVMGDSQRDPTPDEQKQMESLVAKAMQDGAVGLSTGLIYVPGTYSKTPEVIGLAKAAASFNGVYASHIRNEGDNVTDAIEEAINIGRQAKLPVQISHFKVTYKPNWGKSVKTIEQVEKARQDGIDVTVDQYPYVASSTTLNTVLPTWAFSGGRDSLLYRLKTADIRKKIKDEMAQTLKSKKEKNFSYAFVARYGADTTMNGKTISQINTLKGRKPKASEEIETVLEMVENGSAQMAYFSMNEEDVARIMKVPYSMIASDAGVAKFNSGVPHPRAYGTNARVLGNYVRDQKIIGLEEAIRRMTSLPARKFSLNDRGLIREGMSADILIFDEKTVRDVSTFQQPHAYSTGFKYVIVNGAVTMENGQHTGVRNGVVLYGAGKIRAGNP
jgi:N-acyl-D-amino-acid deacylase